MDNQNKSPESMECPVCSKEFSITVIQNHVDKCLFLNESRNESKVESKSSPFSKAKNKAVTKTSKIHCENGNINSNAESFTRHQSSPSNYKTLEHPELNVSLENKNSHVFNKEVRKEEKTVPLAEKMRPTNILSYVGQAHVLGPQSLLQQLLSKTEIPNIILWGPPGCGKTSLANIIANICKYSPEAKYRFVKLSATMSGINDVKEAVAIASNELKFGRRTVIFLDEIHRFNKTQQDTFLPHIESGTITLIGATTENPSYTLNPALLSRCHLIVLEKLTIENLETILKKAIEASNGLICDKQEYTDFSRDTCVNRKFIIDKDAVKWLAETSDGDARIALGGLELAIQSQISNNTSSLSTSSKLISLDDIKESLKKTHMLYDKKGDQHYDTISALHKSIRASDQNAALYWLTRMLASGEDPVYIARRLVRASSEDIGLEDPKALVMAVQTMSSCKMLGMPECDVLLAQLTTYLARAPKSRLMDEALGSARRFISNYKDKQPQVPFHLRNATTNLMNNTGHREENGLFNTNTSEQLYMPEEFENIEFFS